MFNCCFPLFSQVGWLTQVPGRGHVWTYFVENFCNPSVDALHLTTIILNCDSPQATQARRLWLRRASTVCSNFWHDANSRPPFEWVPMAALESLASLNALSNWSSHRNQSSSNRFLWINFIHAYLSITYIIYPMWVRPSFCCLCDCRPIQYCSNHRGSLEEYLTLPQDQ
jgi:hypothetical protein